MKKSAYGFTPNTLVRLTRLASKALQKILSLNGQNYFSNEFIQTLDPVYSFDWQVQGRSIPIRFRTGHGRLLWRAKTFLVEEPLMVKWISGFSSDDVFLDVGANVGTYTVPVAKLVDQVYACELDPMNVSAYSGLCILLFEEKRFDTCLILAEKGVKIDSYRSELYAIIGNCELETGATEKAFEPFRHCLRLDDGNLDAFLGLAAAFTLKDDFENASKNLELARQCAQQKNIRLDGLADMERSGITLHDRKKEALQNLLSHKR